MARGGNSNGSESSIGSRISIDFDIDVLNNVLVDLMDNRHSRVYPHTKGRTKILTELIDMLEKLERKTGKDALIHVDKVTQFIEKNKKTINKLCICSKCKYIEDINCDGSECVVCSGTYNYIVFKSDKYIAYKVNDSKSTKIVRKYIGENNKPYTNEISYDVLYRIYDKLNGKVYQLMQNHANEQILVELLNGGYLGVTSEILLELYKVLVGID